MSTPLRPASPRRELPHLATCLATGQPSCRLGLPVEDCEALRERLLWLIKVRDIVILASGGAVLTGFLLFPGAANWLGLALVIVLTAAANALWMLRRGRLSGCGTFTVTLPSCAAPGDSGSSAGETSTRPPGART